MSSYFSAPPVMKHQSQDSGLLAQIEKKVFEQKPVVGQAYNQYGELSLLDFTNKQFDIPSDVVTDAKRFEVIDVIRQEADILLGADIASQVSSQLHQKYSVITANHHGPITDPSFLNSNLLTHFNATQKKSLLNTIIVLACANVSFDNWSFPRGHFIHSLEGENILTNQMVFFPRKVRPLTVSSHPAYSQESIVSIRERLSAWVREGTFQKQSADKLNGIVAQIYEDPSLFTVDTFSEQVTKTNFTLWKKLVGENSSQLVYLEQEQIVNKLISANHLTKDTIINHILFDDACTEIFIKHFDKIFGGFSLASKSGTYLFWGLPKDQKYRVQLWKEGNKLVSTDGTYSIDLTPESIERAIRERELLPSTLLSFIILSFYYGLSLIGGKNQTTYLTTMKTAYVSFLKDLNATDDIRMVESIPTNKQAVAYPSVAFLSSKNQEIVPATTLDLLLYGYPNYMKIIEKMAKTVTLRQATARALPDWYRAFIPEEQQDEQLKLLSKKDIDFITGFDSIVTPSGELA